jgi:hypothetical protein
VNHKISSRAGKVFLATLVISGVLLPMSCSRSAKSNVAKLSIELADRLTPGQAAPLNEISSVRQSVYVDSSLSMQGFVGNASTAGRTTFDEFIDAMPDVMPGCEVFRYGQPAGQEGQAKRMEEITTKVLFDSQLHDRNFFKLKFNPDDVLITGLAARKDPELSILITDGVESDSKGQVNTAVVDSIRTWMNRGGVFAILIMKSRFLGQFYSERQRHMLDGEVDVSARPFYGFVFSPGWREFEDLKEKLNRRFPQIKYLVFSDDAITCRPEMPAEIDASYAQESPPDKPYYWQMLTMDNPRPKAEDNVVYKFLYDIKSTYPVKSLGIRVTTKLYRWDSSSRQFQSEGSILQLQPTIESSELAIGPSSKVQTFLLGVQSLFQQDAQNDYRFYSIEPSAYIKEADQEVNELSTHDDSSQNTAGRTYRFQELLYALMDVHLKDRLTSRMSPRLYITVANH